MSGNSGGPLPEPFPASEPVDFSDAHLKAAMLRAMRLVAVLSVVLALPLLLFFGWQTALLLLVGAAVSLASLWDWQKLLALISAKLVNQETVGGARTIAGFFLRLLVAGAVLYASLKGLHGSVFALLGGLLLAVAALTVEAFRLIRS